MLGSELRCKIGILDCMCICVLNSRYNNFARSIVSVIGLFTCGGWADYKGKRTSMLDFLMAFLECDSVFKAGYLEINGFRYYVLYSIFHSSVYNKVYAKT